MRSEEFEKKLHVENSTGIVASPHGTRKQYEFLSLSTPLSLVYSITRVAKLLAIDKDTKNQSKRVIATRDVNTVEQSQRNNV